MLDRLSSMGWEEDGEDETTAVEESSVEGDADVDILDCDELKGSAAFEVEEEEYERHRQDGAYMALQKPLFLRACRNHLFAFQGRTDIAVYEQARFIVSRMSAPVLHKHLLAEVYRSFGWPPPVALNLKGQTPLAVIGKRLTVNYEENGHDTPYAGHVVGFDVSRGGGLLVVFDSDPEAAPFTVDDEDDWAWEQ